MVGTSTFVFFFDIEILKENSIIFLIEHYELIKINFLSYYYRVL